MHMARSITFSGRDELSNELTELATVWGYKFRGNGGYTAFIGDVLEAIIDESKKDNSSFDLSQLITKKTSAK